MGHDNSNHEDIPAQVKTIVTDIPAIENLWNGRKKLSSF